MSLGWIREYRQCNDVVVVNTKALQFLLLDGTPFVIEAITDQNIKLAKLLAYRTIAHRIAWVTSRENPGAGKSKQTVNYEI
jgi:hypothetical protein